MVPVMMRRTASVWALLAVAALLCGAARAQTSPPPLPPWVRLRTDADTPQRAALLNWNRMLVANANRTNATFDLAWWGDSTTSTLMMYMDAMAVWDEFWGFSQRWTAGILGVGATDIEELTWRMAVGGERFRNDPLVAVLLIGINNSPSDPLLPSKLDFLLRWMAAAMPRTKIVVLAPNPSRLGISALLLQAYRPVLRARGVELSLCGQDMNWRDRGLFFDGIHMTAAGYRRLFTCLYPRLLFLRNEQRVARFGYTWS